MVQDAGNHAALITNRLSRFRAALERNKIIFETLAAFSLSAMAVIVALAQYQTTSKQTKLIALQTQIAEAQALPQFEVAIRQKLNDETGKYDDNYLVVGNHGGAVHEFAAQAAYFLDVSVSVQLRSGKIELPTNGYFTTQEVSSSGTGRLTTNVGNHNNATFLNLVEHAREEAKTRNWDYALVEERILLNLKYRDLLDRMADAEGLAAFRQSETAQRLELSTLNATNLLNAAAKIVDELKFPK